MLNTSTRALGFVKRSRYLALVTLAIILVGPATTRAGGAEIPSSITVLVAYADTEGRAPDSGDCANCFPSPWCGSPGVLFIGSSTNYNGNPTDTSNCNGGAWDTAAILVNNTGTTPITLTDLTVILPLPASGDRGSPSCVAPPRPIAFNLWFGQKYYFDDRSQPAYNGGQIIIPPGGQAIFAGTSSDGSYTCPTGNYPSAGPKATYDFDTSDANFLSGCTPTTDTVSDPQIIFTATGFAITTYIDKGHVTDTGGIDPGNCHPTAVDPQWGHENLGWRPVSSTCGESCPLNQLEAALTASTSSLRSASSSTVATASGGIAETGVPTTLYGTVAVGIVIIVGIGYVLTRRRRPS